MSSIKFHTKLGSLSSKLRWPSKVSKSVFINNFKTLFDIKMSILIKLVTRLSTGIKILRHLSNWNHYTLFQIELLIYNLEVNASLKIKENLINYYYFSSFWRLWWLYMQWANNTSGICIRDYSYEGSYTKIPTNKKFLVNLSERFLQIPFLTWRCNQRERTLILPNKFYW